MPSFSSGARCTAEAIADQRFGLAAVVRGVVGATTAVYGRTCACCGHGRDRQQRRANELFYNQGVQTVGIDRVIEQAGVAKASLYNTFGSKEALVHAYLEARHASVTERSCRRWTLRGAAERMLAVFEGLAKCSPSPTTAAARSPWPARNRIPATRPCTPRWLPPLGPVPTDRPGAGGQRGRPRSPGRPGCTCSTTAPARPCGWTTTSRGRRGPCGRVGPARRGPGPRDGDPELRATCPPGDGCRYLTYTVRPNVSV